MTNLLSDCLLQTIAQFRNLSYFFDFNNGCPSFRIVSIFLYSMSGLLFRGLTLTCFLALLFSCKKINDSEYAPKTTDLKVRVYEYDFDNSLAGGPIAAAEVFVYHTRTNFFLRVGHVATGKTDASGEITFTDLDPQNYYIYVRKFKDSTFYQNYFMDSLDSKNTNFNIGEALIKNAITTVSIPVAEAKYPTKFALKGFTRINREDSHYVADSLKYIHIDMFNQDYTTDGEIRTGIAAGGGDDKNSSDFTVAKEFNGLCLCK